MGRENERRRALRFPDDPDGLQPRIGIEAREGYLEERKVMEFKCK